MPSKKRSNLVSAPSPTKTAVPGSLLGDVRDLIAKARDTVSRGVNAALVMLYWNIGGRIRHDVLNEKRAGYGDKIVSALATQLETEFGRSFAERNLRRMIQFSEVFPDPEIVSALTTQLQWTHFVDLLPLHKPHQRDFYAEMCRVERWSTRTLREKINGMLYERTALSKKPDKLIEKELADLRERDRFTPDLVFRDPYLLDFLGLKDTYSEKDLESAILRDLEAFLVELGGDFAFVARQKRITVDGEDFYLDLLFYHRGLRRLVVIELKLGKFAPADVGQMEFYLRWLEKHERRPGEEAPIGLILCAEKSDERVEIFELASRGVRVAEYLTALPPRKLLEERLHLAVQRARKRIEDSSPNDASENPLVTVRAKKDAPTRQQGQFLSYIHEYQMRQPQSAAPTHAILQQFFDLTPPSVNSMLQRLEQRGFIRRIPGKARGIELTIDPALLPKLNRPFKG